MEMADDGILRLHFLPWRPGFNPRPVCMGFMVDKWHCYRLSLSTMVVPQSIIPPMHHLPSFICHQYY